MLAMSPRVPGDYQGALDFEDIEDGSDGPPSIMTTEKHPLEIEETDGGNDDVFADEHDEDGYSAPPASHKSIGKLGSYAIAVNALAGPGILQLPFTYQQAGVIPTTFALLVVGLISALCCMHTANVVSKVPGNSNFDKVIEFSDPYRIFWNQRAYYGTQIVFYLCTLCVNIAAIVDTSEIVDSFLGHSSMGTWGFAFDAGGTWKQWIHEEPCSRMEVKLDECSPFDGEEEYGKIILTLGYIFTTAVFLPICLMDLKENTAWQILGFTVLLTISTQFVICFLIDGLNFGNVSLWGETWSSMLGVILFNFGLVMAIPSWLAEKKETVSVSRVVYGSTAVSLVLYVAVGLLGALSIPNVNVNALDPMTSGAFGTPLRIGASIFAFFIIGLDIPLFAVLTRYNLVNSGLCSTRVANVFVVYLPWSLSWLFYQGSAVSELLAWGGILFTGALAFLLPLYLAIRVLRQTSEKVKTYEDAPTSAGDWSIDDDGDDGDDSHNNDDDGDDSHSNDNVGDAHEDFRGSIDVYLGFFQSREAELRATVVVMIASFTCVVLAIAGQLYYDEQEEMLMHRESYVNSTQHGNN